MNPFLMGIAIAFFLSEKSADGKPSAAEVCGYLNNCLQDILIDHEIVARSHLHTQLRNSRIVVGCQAVLMWS